MFISEIGDIRRFPTAEKLSMYAGIARMFFASEKCLNWLQKMPRSLAR
ncbi:transposase [Paenibacillus athensensis]|nr:transposase [Paenibacillus athensensis]